MEWNYQKNDIDPNNIMFNSSQKVWWKCKNGHEWQATIYNRNKGTGCPYCSGKIPSSSNNISVTNPKLLLEWDYEHNGKLTPQMVSKGSVKKVWWKCKKGHFYEMAVYNKVKDIGCPYCANESHTSFPEQTIYYYFKNIYPNTKNRSKVDNIEIDVFISNLKVGIEYDGIYYHGNKTKRKKDKLKEKKLKDLGIYLIRVIESKNVDKIAIDKNKILYKYDSSYSNLNLVILEIAKLINKHNNNNDCILDSIDISKDKLNILKMYYSELKKNSIASIPRLLCEYDLKKNKINPKFLSVGNSNKVWWKCKKGHEWQARISHRVSGSNCPYCSGRLAIVGKNDILTTNKELMSEWNYAKNENVDVQNIKENSNKKVWWKCKKGHEWQAVISSRSKGNGCPYCSGRLALIGENDLTTTSPSLINEWNYEKNDILPTSITACSGKKVWWKCEKGHEWQALVYNRSKGSGCPLCYREKRNH